MSILKDTESPKNKWINRIKKLSVPVALILLAIGLSFLLPKSKMEEVSSQMGILALIITKTIFASCGFAFAYIVKELSFSYLSLQELLLEHHWPGVIFLTVWYAICIYCFSLGG